MLWLSSDYYLLHISSLKKGDTFFSKAVQTTNSEQDPTALYEASHNKECKFSQLSNFSHG